MKVTNLGKVPATPVELEGAEGVVVQRPVAGADGAPTFSMRVFTVSPGGHTPFHTHQWEHENYIIAGRGALVSESGEEHPVSAGDFCLVMPGEKHCYRNSSDTERLIFICAVPVDHE
ncbi:MAG: cupin domain-containing protein [Chitinivibrionales bacterium]|nr:cupin domain-containing protein [Chitinivibrionales bacterium]